MTHGELVSALKKGIVMTGNRLASHEESANLYRRTILAVVELCKPSDWDNDDNFYWKQEILKTLERNLK